MTVYPASAYKAAPPHEDDSLLVEMVKQLSAELGVPSMAPNSLVWAALVPKDMLDGSTRQAGRFTRIAPGDQVRLVSQAMFLPADLRGELRLEEWRSLRLAYFFVSSMRSSISDCSCLSDVSFRTVRTISCRPSQRISVNSLKPMGQLIPLFSSTAVCITLIAFLVSRRKCGGTIPSLIK